MEPLLSVCLITYNHKPYIRQAIEGVLIQKVDFPIELIIADDFSTDGTRDILVEYQEKYPDFIRLVLQERNVGPTQNWTDLITAPKAKYIAYFEGDDYWTDEQKLKKQVSILETDHTISIVSARAGHQKGNSQIENGDAYSEGYFGIEGLVNDWKCQTLTVMFRRSMMDIEKLAAYKVIYDTMLYYELLKKGRGYYLNTVVGVYRHHNAGEWHGKTEMQKLKLTISQFHAIWTKNKKDRAIKNKLGQLFLNYLRDSTFFTTTERSYYVRTIINYLRVTKDYKYLKLLFINHVRHLRGN
jgi:glycosyltransferase involved in cell wall biosynthesis